MIDRDAYVADDARTHGHHDGGREEITRCLQQCGKDEEDANDE